MGKVKVKDRLKGLGDKLDKKALASAIGLMLISWAALPIIYCLLVRKKDSVKEVKKEEKGDAREI